MSFAKMSLNFLMTNTYISVSSVPSVALKNSCSFVVIPYIFSLCRSLSAVAPALHSTQCGGGLAKADGFVAMR